MELFAFNPWCSCRCATRCESSQEDELPIRFVEDLEELTNVDVFLEKVEAAVKRCSLPPGAQRTVMVLGDGNQTGTLCNLIAGKDSFESQPGRLVNHWESVDGAISILELDLAHLANLEGNDPLIAQNVSHSEAVAQAAREALADLLLWAHRGINVLLYVVPFGPVSEERIRRLIFLTQYLLGNELLLHLYVVVTDVPSSLHGTSEWISAFADSDFGFRHLYTLAGKNPSRFVTLRKHQADAIGQELSIRKALLSACGRHPVQMMPAFHMKQMQEVLSKIQEERSKLDELQSKVRKLQNELQRPPNGSPQGKESPAILNQKQALPVISGGDLNAKVITAPPRHLWRSLQKAEADVLAAQALMERKLHQVKVEGTFQQQVDDLAFSALRRFRTDLEVSDASKGSFANREMADAFGKGRATLGSLGREVPARFQFFLSTSASCVRMTNSEDRPPSLIFDWDDTLCPTTWMRQFAEITDMDHTKLQLHSGRIEQVLRAARSFGYVDIVTMANRQWLDQSIGLLKSKDLDLWNLFEDLGIEVHYAQPSPSRVLKGDARESISAKKGAMSAVLDKYYGDSVKARVHVLSFGDQDAEAVALQEVLQAAQGVSWFRPICKVLRLPSEPDLEELRGSLRKILTNLPALLRTESDLDLHVYSLEAR